MMPLNSSVAFVSALSVPSFPARQPARVALRPRRPPASCAAKPPGDGQAATPPPDASPDPSYKLAPGEIAVRFINSPLGDDVVAAATPGDNLLAVGDSVGIHIPRACQSGLCGSCTCDVLDANSPDGRQTIRACKASALIPDDGPELVVDVERMQTARAGYAARDPMTRFENLDVDYVAGAPPRPASSKLERAGTLVACPDCAGSGVSVCYDCDGSPEGMCSMCMGSGSLRCAFCQGKGERHVRR